jgi:hypothetical protein
LPLPDSLDMTPPALNSMLGGLRRRKLVVKGEDDVWRITDADLVERQQVVDVHHDCEADDLWRTVEAAERISHPKRLCGSVGRLKLDWSHTAHIAAFGVSGYARGYSPRKLAVFAGRIFSAR